MKTVNEIRTENLNALAREYGGPIAFADFIGKDRSQVSQWLNNSIDSKTGKPRHISSASCRQIEAKCGKQIGWLDTPHDSTSTESSPKAGEEVPLISWATAGKWPEISAPYEPGIAESWLPCPRKHSNRAFALRIRGESMENPGGKPSYSDGEIIYADPLHPYENGSRVVVRLDANPEAIFRQLIIEGGRKYLKALNPSWPEPIIEINGNATICGVVIGTWRDR